MKGGYASHDPKPLKLTPEQVAELAAQVGTGTVGPKGDKGDPGINGRDGITPVKGIDYFDGLNSTVPGPPGYTPIKNVDYFDGATGVPGYTPIKGVDYNDGLKGDKGDPGTAATVTKPAVEAVLTGEITSHSHPASGGSDPWVRIKLAADFVTSLATNVNITGFAFTPAINKTYLIFGYFLLRTATATIGARPGVAWPANLTDSTMRVEAANSLTASALQLFGARTTKNAASTGLATTADSHWGSLDGIMITSGTTSGTFQITLASETAGTNVTMKAGSVLMYREL
jgi:hypothetical protein